MHGTRACAREAAVPVAKVCCVLSDGDQCIIAAFAAFIAAMAAAVSCTLRRSASTSCTDNLAGAGTTTCVKQPVKAGSRQIRAWVRQATLDTDSNPCRLPMCIDCARLFRAPMPTPHSTSLRIYRLRHRAQRSSFSVFERST